MCCYTIDILCITTLLLCLCSDDWASTYTEDSGNATPPVRHYDYNKGNHFSENDLVPVFGVFAGASYFFTPVFGVNIEAGRDVNTFQAGIIFKLR